MRGWCNGGGIERHRDERAARGNRRNGHRDAAIADPRRPPPRPLHRLLSAHAPAAGSNLQVAAASGSAGSRFGIWTSPRTFQLSEKMSASDTVDRSTEALEDTYAQLSRESGRTDARHVGQGDALMRRRTRRTRARSPVCAPSWTHSRVNSSKPPRSHSAEPADHAAETSDTT